MSMTRRSILAALPASLIALVSPAQASPFGLGIIFVMQSDCPYCAAAAPVLYQLQQDAGVPVMLASMDGLAIHPFERAEDARLNPLTSRYPSVPQVLIYNAKLDGVTHEFGGFRNMRHFVNQLSSALRQASEV